MKIVFCLFFFFLSYPLFAQTPDSLTEEGGDTLETIISDTTIIYIIQKAPVTIREKVEILKPKPKKLFFLSTNFSILTYSEKRKAITSYEEYLKKINSAISDYSGYSIGASLWKCRKKIYNGIGMDFLILKQHFSFSDAIVDNYKATNAFNYLVLNPQLGYWIGKGKKISCIGYGSIQGSYTLSYSGFTYDKTSPSIPYRINGIINYRKYLINFSANAKFLISLNKALIEIEPYVIIAPFSATVKNEAYSIRRTFIGIKFGLVHKLY
jgi:hypothetical protein